MFYSRLLTLIEDHDESKIIKLQNYFTSLNPNNLDKITLSKIIQAVECNEEEAVLILKKCLEIGILSISYGIRCPNCGMLIKKMVSDNIDDVYITNCYNCEEDIDLTSDDIVALFSLKVEIPPFDLGQREETGQQSQPDNRVAQRDTVIALKIFGFDERYFEGLKIENVDFTEKKRLLSEKRDIDLKIDERVNGAYKTNFILYSLLLFSSLVLGIVICFAIYKINIEYSENANNVLTLLGLIVVPICAILLNIFLPIDKEVLRKDIFEEYKYVLEDILLKIEEISNKYK